MKPTSAEFFIRYCIEPKNHQTELCYGRIHLYFHTHIVAYISFERNKIFILLRSVSVRLRLCQAMVSGYLRMSLRSLRKLLPSKGGKFLRPGGRSDVGWKQQTGVPLWVPRFFGYQPVVTEIKKWLCSLEQGHFMFSEEIISHPLGILFSFHWRTPSKHTACQALSASLMP